MLFLNCYCDIQPGQCPIYNSDFKSLRNGKKVRAGIYILYIFNFNVWTLTSQLEVAIVVPTLWGGNYVSNDIYFCLQKIIHICFCFFNFPLFGVLDLSAGDPAVPAGLPPSVGRVPGLGRLRTNTAHLQTSFTTIMTQFDLGHKGSNFLFLMDQSTNFYCITPYTALVYKLRCP